MKNPGKLFEQDVVKSMPEYVYVHRLKDSAQSFKNSASWSWDNPCDFYFFDSDRRVFYAIECKSTKYKSMSVQTNKDDDSSKMIKYHQVSSLIKISKYNGVVAGFFLNFRDEKNDTERLYFINTKNFVHMMGSINKVSFNEIDLLTNNAIKIDGNRKRKRFKWNIDSFMKVYEV